MSSHCNRYPECGCAPEVGTKCDLPDGHPRLSEKEVIVIDDSPSVPSVTTQLLRVLKQDGLTQYSNDNVSGQKKRRRGSNYTPPKKKRK